MAYEPRGKMVELIAAMRAAPARVFKAGEVAAILCCKNFPSTIEQYIYAACAGGLVFKRRLDGAWYYAGAAISDELLDKNGIAVPSPGANLGPRVMRSPGYSAEEVEVARSDVRAPKVETGWVPPKMVAPRGQAAPALDLGKRTTSAATASGHEIPDVASTPESAGTAGPEQERPAVANEGDARVASGGRAQLVAEEAPAEVPAGEAEAEPFDACFWLDGDVDLHGLIELEDGGYRILAKDVRRLRERLAWMPAC